MGSADAWQQGPGAGVLGRFRSGVVHAGSRRRAPVGQFRVAEPVDECECRSVVCKDLRREVIDADGPTLQKLALDMVRGWDPTLRRMVAGCDPATIVGMRFGQSTPVEPWPSTTVTVLGDAIHNMTPVGGLGANSALRDAAALAEQLLAVRDGAPLRPAIAEYETQMRDWGYTAVRESGANAQRAIASNPVARRAGRAYFRTRRVLRNLNRRNEPTPQPGMAASTDVLAGREQAQEE